MATKKTTKKKTLRKPKKRHGGARRGAGRPATGRVVTKTKWVRCSDAAADAIDEHVEKLNADRGAAGLKPVSFSKWASEVLLLAAGRKDLTEAANPIVE